MSDSESNNAAPETSKSRAGFVGPLALVVALVAAALAGLALYRSGGESPSAPESGPVAAEEPNPTEQQPGDAKAHICDAFNIVRNAVSLQTHADLGTDPVALQAVAANARLSMVGGANYLQSRIDPAAPVDLVDAVQTFSRGLQDIGMNALAGATNQDPAQSARLQDAQAASDRIAEMCK